MKKLYFFFIALVCFSQSLAQITTPIDIDFSSPSGYTLSGAAPPEWEATGGVLTYSGNGPAGVLVTDDLDVTSLSNIVLEIDLGSFADNESFEANGSDYLLIEYSYDGGSLVELAEWAGDGGIYLTMDTDEIAGGDGTNALTETLKTYAFSIPNSGTDLNVRITALGSHVDEQIYVDNLRIKTYGPAGFSPTISKNDVVNGDKDATTNDDEVSFDIVFNRFIDPSTFTASDITIGGTATTTPGALVNSGDDKIFTFTVDPSTDGTVNISLGAAVLNDIAGNDNAASGPSSDFTMDYTAPAIPTALNLATADDTGASNTDNITQTTSGLTIDGSGENGSTIKLTSDVDGILAGSAVVSGGVWSFDISLSDNNTHEITATATDVAGNTSAASTALTIVTDNTNPAAPTALDLAAADDTGASDTDNITQTTSGITIDGNGENGSTITLTSDVDGILAGSGIVTGGVWSFDITLSDNNTHNITATATDPAGNTGVASVALTIVTDNEDPNAPTALNLAAADDTGASNTDNITQTTSGLTIDGSGENGSTIKLTSDVDGILAGSAVVSGGVWSFDITLSDNNTHNITATATDPAGNTSAASAALTIVTDNEDPNAPTALNLAAADDTGASDTDNITQTTSGLTIDGSGENGSTIKLTSDVDGILAGSAVVSGGVWSFDITLSDNNTHNITATATDPAGNTSAASAALTIVTDNEDPNAPTALNLAAADDTGASDTDNITQTTSGLTIDGSGENGSTIKLTSDVDGILAGSAVVSGGVWSFDITLSDNSTHNITATQTDLAGNTGVASVALTIVTDNANPAAPTALNLAAADDTGASDTDNITQTTSGLTIDGSGENGSTIKLTSDVDGILAGSAVVSGGVWSFDITLSDNSTHNITAMQTDLAGNTGVASVALTIVTDNANPAAPTALNLAAADDTGASDTDNITQTTLGLTIDGSGENGSTIKLTSDVDGILAGSAVVSGGVWSFDITLSDNNTHEITATATDVAGNSSVASAALTIVTDNANPVAPTVLNMAAADDTGASDTDNITQTTSGLTIDGSGENGSTIKLTSDVDGILAGSAVVSGGVWSFDITLSDNSTHNITATQTDLAGNTGVASVALTIVTDNTAPATPNALNLAAADDTGASNTDNITQTTSGLTIDGSGENGSTITLTSNVDGNLVGSAVVAGGLWSFDISLSDNGAHDITAIATDVAGNTSAASIALTIITDNDAPTNQDVVFAASVEENSNTAISIVSSGDINNRVWFAPTGTSSFSGSATMTQAASGIATTILSPDDEGTYHLYVIDLAGNISDQSAATLIVDDTPPSISIGAPSISDASNASTVDYPISYSDANSFTVGLTDGDISLNTTGDASATFTVLDGATSNPTVQLTSATGNGTIGISIALGTATDLAGNQAGAQGPSATFNVDNVQPQATITISDDPIYTGDLTQVVTVTYDEPMDNGTSPVITFSGSSNFNSEGDGSWNLANDTWTETFTHDGTPEEGLSAIASVANGSGATDLAGNAEIGDDSPSFIVDTQRPTFVVVQHFPNSGASNSNRDVLRAEVSEEITLDGTMSPFPALSISNDDNFTTAGFRVTVDGNFKDFVTGSANSGAYDNSYNVYQNDGVVRNEIANIRSLRFEGSNNSQWDGTESPRLSYIQGGGIFDLAGNEMATVLDVLSVDGDITPPTIEGTVVLYPNGSLPETIVFSVNEILDVLEGGDVIGFAVSTGAIASAVYTDAEITKTITLTSATNGQWDNSVTLSYFSDGTTTNVKDVSGNEMVDFTGSGVIYESIPPTITALSIESNNPTSTLVKGGEVVTITFTADDGLDVNGIQLSDIRSGGDLVVNNGAITYAGTATLFEFTAQFTVASTDTDGPITFKLDYKDEAGNAGTQLSETDITDATSVTVDNTVPAVTSSTIVDASPNNTASVDFTVIFSEDVSGVDVGDFTITQTNLTGATVSNVDAVSGTEYTVSVNSINLDDNVFSGTLRLDFASDGTVTDNAGLATITNFISGETYTIIHPEPSEDVPSLSFVTGTNTTTEVSWTESVVDQLPNRYLVMAKKSTETFPAVTDNTFIADGIQAGGAIAINVTRGTTSHTFTGLASGTNYDFIIYPHTNDGANVNYKIDVPAEASGITTTASISTLTSGAGTEPETISSLITTDGTAILNLDFTITDDGTNPAEDDASMTISEIVITPNASNNEITDWSSTIAGAVLTDGVESITGTINTADITFTSIPNGDEELGEIDDNEAKTYILKIWFNTALPAGSDLLQFDFEVLSENVSYNNPAASSKLAGTQAVSSGGDKNIIDVKATEFNILQQPPLTATAGIDVTPQVQIEATDANGNRDLDYIPVLEITNSAGFDMINVPTEPADLNAGVLTFPTGFQFSDGPDDNITLTVKDATDPDPLNHFEVTTNSIDLDAHAVFSANVNGTVTGSTLVSGETNQAVMGFEIAAEGNFDINGLTITTSSDVTDKLSNFRLIESTDNNAYNALTDVTSIGTFTIAAGDISLSGTPLLSFTDNEVRYFYIVADVEVNVNFTMPTVTFTMTDTDVDEGTDVVDDFIADPIESDEYIYKDIINPDASSLTPDITLITDVDEGNKVSLAIVFNEHMNREIAPVITFPTAGENPIDDGTLSADASSGWVDELTYIAKFLITDKNLTMHNIDVQVSAARDTTGNTVNTVLFNDEFSIDMENTTASTAVADSGNPNDASLIVDATTGPGAFTITITFPEDMDDSGANDPVITFPTAGEDPSATLTFDAGIWPDQRTYVATYDVADGNETIDNIDIEVAGARDAALNLMTPTTFVDVFSIDNKNAEITDISTNFTTLSDSEAGSGTFKMVVIYSEAMDQAIKPSFTFPDEDPSSTITQNIVNSNWEDAVTFVAIYDVTDVNLTLPNIDVDVADAEDVNGNLQDAFSSPNLFHIDTENPEVTGVTSSLPIISDANTTFSLTVDFTEDMISDGTKDPVITFPDNDPSAPAATPTLTYDNGVWNSPTQFVATYTVTDQNLTMEDIDVHIGFAEDIVGNVQVDGLFTDVFSVDMTNPVVASVTAQLVSINSSDTTVINDDHVTDVGTYELIITFNEDMIDDGTANPVITYPVDVSASLTSVVSEVWDDNRTYRINYNLADDHALFGNLDPQIDGAKDLIGNILVTHIEYNAFSIHTDNPIVSNVIPNVTLVGDPLEGSATFNIQVLFDEPMLRAGHDPVITLSPNTSNTITFSHGIWNTAGTVYTAFYDVDGEENEIIPDISVQVQNAMDSSANNISVDTTFPDVFNINTDNPSTGLVTSANPTGFYNEGDEIKLWVIFDKDVTVVGSPLLALNVGINATYSGIFNGQPKGDTLEFIYIVQAGHTAEPLEYTSTNALLLNSATIKDDVENDADLALPALGSGFSLEAKDIIIDTDVPELVAGTPFSPINDSHNVPLAEIFTIDFDEEVIGGGNGAFVKIINYDNPAEEILIDMDVILGTDPFNPETTISFTIPGLVESTEYYVVVEDGAITDRAGNDYAGFGDSDTWFFTTFGAPILSEVSNVNPCIGEEIGLKGQFFTGVSEIRMNGSTGDLVTQFTVINDDSISLIIPKGALPGSVYFKKEINEVNPGGTYANEDTRNFTSSQSLTVGPRAAEIQLVGNENICDLGNNTETKTSIEVNISGGNSSYTVKYTDGDTEYERVNYTSGNDIVHPVNSANELDYEFESPNTFTLISVMDGNGCYVVGSEDTGGNPLGTAVDNAHYYDSLTGSATINLYKQSVVNAGPDQIFCFLVGDTIQLAGSINGSVTSGAWITSVQENLVNPTDLSSKYRISLNDVYQGFVEFTLTSDNPAAPNPCAPVDDIVRVNLTSVAVADAGGNQDLCFSDPEVELNGIVTAGATQGLWTSLSTATNKGVFENPVTELINRYIPSEEEIQNGSVNLQLETTNSECPPDVEAEDIITINFSSNPTLAPLNQSGNNDLEVCAGSSLLEYKVTGTDNEGSTFVWNYSTDAVNLRSGKNTNTILVDILEQATGEHYTTIRVFDSIRGVRCHSDTVEFDLKINQEVTPAFVNPANRNFGTSLAAQQLNGDGSSTNIANHLFSGPGVYYSATQQHYYFDPAGAGIGNHLIKYTYTNPLTSCSASISDVFSVFDVNQSIVLTEKDEDDQEIVLQSAFCEYEEDVNITISENLGIPVGFEFYDFTGFGILNNDPVNKSATFSPAAAYQQRQQQGGVITISYRIIDAMENIDTLGSQDVQLNKTTIPSISTSINSFCSNSLPLELEKNDGNNPIYPDTPSEYKFFLATPGYEDLVRFDSELNNYVFYPEEVDFAENDFAQRNLQLAYTYTDIQGCVDTLIINTSVSQQPPTPVVANKVLCQDDELTAFSIENGISDATFAWRNSTTNELLGPENTFFPPIENTNSTLTAAYIVTQSINGCLSPSKNISLEILAKPSVSFDVAGDDIFCVDDAASPITLSPNPSSLPQNTTSVFEGEIDGIINNEGVFTFSPFTAADSVREISSQISQTMSYKAELNYPAKNITCSNSSSQVIVINPLPTVSINKNSVDSVFCAGSTAIDLIGNNDNQGDFDGRGVDGDVPGNYLYNPSDDLSNSVDTVTYAFTDANGCSNIDTIYMTVHKRPATSFNYGTACIGDPIEFYDNTPDADEPVSWTWEFLNNSNNIENTLSGNEVSYQYNLTGTTEITRNVRLSVTTINGCEADTIKQIIINPIPSITFNHEYIVANDPTEFSGISIVPANEPIQSVTWNYNDEEARVVDDGFTGQQLYTFASSGYKKVEATVMSLAGCDSTTVDTTIFIVPRVFPSVSRTISYSFDDDNASFISNGGNGLWQHGNPTGFSINGNTNAWMTGLSPETYPANVHAYLYTPCFDLTDLERPMISFDLATYTSNVDGMVLQYSVNGKKDDWITLGKPDNGLNWFNVTGINSQPGGQQLYGWQTTKDTTWIEAKLPLDEISEENRDKVIFRFAFASGNVLPGAELDGAAIDNFFIGERTRSVLLEHFTNINNMNGTEVDQEGFNTFQKDDDDVVVVKLAYHTAFPANDLLNKDNSGDVGARVLYYNINSSPTTIMDGIFSNTKNDIGTGNFGAWVDKQFSRRTLERAQAEINVELGLDGHEITITPVITPLTDLPENVTIHVGVVEKGISRNDLGLPNGNDDIDTFHYVMKKLLPDARGTKFTRPKADIALEFDEVLKWAPQNVYPKTNIMLAIEDLAVVVFVQGDSTRTIYQATTVDVKDLPALDQITGVDKDLLAKNLSIYPIPASTTVNLSHAIGWHNDQTVKLFDHAGKLVMIGQWHRDEKKMEIDTRRLSAGVYYVQIEDDKLGLHTRKKIMIIQQ